MTLLMEKLDNSHIGVVEFPLFHENELTVGFASRTWHANSSVTFSTTLRGSLFIMFTVGESWIKKCVSVYIQCNGKLSPKYKFIKCRPVHVCIANQIFKIPELKHSVWRKAYCQHSLLPVAMLINESVSIFVTRHWLSFQAQTHRGAPDGRWGIYLGGDRQLIIRKVWFGT